jgi:molecular chaperone GrpE
MTTEEQNSTEPSKEGSAEEKLGETADAAAASVEAQLEEAKKKAEDYYTRLLYLQAEFENYKKRVDKEKGELLKYGSEKAMLQFLPALDHLALALESARRNKDGDAQSIIKGLEMTYENLVGIFDVMGVKFFESVGQAFDPHVHEAVMEKETKDSEPNTVLQEFQKGCKFNGRLLRPAKVVVSKQG